MERLEIIIDNREGKRIHPCKKYFEKEKEYTTKVKQLKYGDYVCGNCCIEYKTTNDLIHSIQEKRIFKQAVNMKNNYEHHYVFMESEKVVLQNEIKKSRFVGRQFSWNQYYGAISSLAQITTPIVVPNFKHACGIMKYLFKKCNDNKVRDVFIAPKKHDNFLVNSLASVTGGVTALLIVDELGLNSLEDVTQITYDDLINIKGIGDKTANKLMKAIYGGNY